MAALPEVYLARHSETAWTITGQHTGRTDIPLTARGELDARSLAQRLKGMEFAKVLVSPPSRAHQDVRAGGVRQPSRNRPRPAGMGLWPVRRAAHRGYSPGASGLGSLPRRLSGRRVAGAGGCAGGPGDRPGPRRPWRCRAVRARARVARARGALDRVASGCRAAFLARYGHAVRARLLPRHTRCEGLERASPRLAQ